MSCGRCSPNVREARKVDGQTAVIARKEKTAPAAVSPAFRVALGLGERHLAT